MLMRTFMRTAPAMATHVRVLSLGIGQNYHTHVQGTEMADVINMFPYLYELRLHLDNPPIFNTETIQQLKSTPPIRALRITLSETDQCPDVLFQILQIPWPLLHLSVTRPFASDVYWMTEEKIQEQKIPPWKLIEYRTDGFLGYEVLLEWVVLNSLETLTVLHMPPDPRSTPLTLVSPRLRSLNLIHDPNASGVFEGMWYYPPFPVLQELTVTNAILVPDPRIYQSIPPNVTYFATSLCIKLQTMIGICPTIPMRIGSITVYHDGKQAHGREDIVNDYMRMDPRLIMRRQQTHVSL
jgi:hypothetical protein